MSTGEIIAIVVVVVILLGGAIVFLLPKMRSQRLRRTFGPEYDHAVEHHDSRRAAEQELADRKQRHARYTLRPLTAETKARYEESWHRVQERFIEAPADSVAAADRLVNGLVAELGYPSEGYERQVADLSVRHPHAVRHYRTAHDVRSVENASTDDLRTALIGYREVFQDLLGDDHARDSHDSRANGVKNTKNVKGVETEEHDEHTVR
jgi:hypothetical protein